MSGGLPPTDPYYGGAPSMPGYPPMMGPKVGTRKLQRKIFCYIF